MKVRYMIDNLKGLLEESKKYGNEDPDIFFISKNREIHPINLLTFTRITNENGGIDESFMYVTDNDNPDIDVYHQMLEEAFPEEFPRDDCFTIDMYLPPEKDDDNHPEDK